MVSLLYILFWFVHTLVFFINKAVFYNNIYMDSLLSKNDHVVLLIRTEVPMVKDSPGSKKNYETDQLFRSQEHCSSSLNSLYYPFPYVSFFAYASGVMLLAHHRIQQNWLKINETKTNLVIKATSK